MLLGIPACLAFYAQDIFNIEANFMAKALKNTKTWNNTEMTINKQKR